MRLLMMAEFLTTAALFTPLVLFAPPADVPPKKGGIVVLGEVQSANAPVTPTKVTVAPGRYVPIAPADGSPSYLAASKAYRVYRVSKGTLFTGVKYDAPAGAEPESSSWDRDVLVLLIRNVPGVHQIQLVKNGETGGPPVENGPPIDIDVQGAQPPPKPDPIPEPKPKPPPIDPEPKPEPKIVVGPLWIVTVAESSERDPDFAKLVNDTAYWQSLSKQGHKARHYDKDDENAIKGGYVKHANKVGLPAIVFVDDDGDLVKVVKAPKTTAEVSAILKGLVGQ